MSFRYDTAHAFVRALKRRGYVDAHVAVEQWKSSPYPPHWPSVVYLTTDDNAEPISTIDQMSKALKTKQDKKENT